MKIRKRHILSLVCAAALICISVLLGMSAFAAEPEPITFDIAGGDVIIDGNIYSGYIPKDGGGYEKITGTHLSSNIYLVTGTWELERHAWNDSGYDHHNIQILGSDVTVNLVIEDLTIRNRATKIQEVTTKQSFSSIYIPANPGQEKNVTIKIKGTNELDNILYYTGRTDQLTETAKSTSKLKITSASGDKSTDGKLTVGYEYASIENRDTVFSCAIGAEGCCSLCTGLEIAGGTIVATGWSAEATIGSGSNSDAEITISGGDITATHTALSNGVSGAAIGGGGGDVASGNLGRVTITGGTVRTYNINGGNGIGGGDSNSRNGGAGIINISGNDTVVISDSNIGGGLCVNGPGGDAEVNISGGTINAVSIGGGQSTLGNGGAVTNFSVTGGDLTVTGNIGGGDALGSGAGGDVTTFIITGTKDSPVTVHAGSVGGGNSVGGMGGSIGELTVEYGELYLTGGIGGGETKSEGAGINGGNVEIININNGTIEAAFIGGGNAVVGAGGTVNELSVTGGQLTVTGNIGGGTSESGAGGNVPTFKVEKSIVNAVSVGGGNSESGAGGYIGTLTITEGELYLTGGIGGGETKSASASINGGNVETINITSGSIIEAAFIGGGNAFGGTGGAVNELSVNGSELTVTGNIGGGTSENGAGGYIGTITITDGELYLTGGIGGGETKSESAGISGGNVETINITSGSIIEAAFIGGGNAFGGTGGAVNELSVNGSELTVTGNIGGGTSENGDGGDVTNIEITNSKINAGAIGGGDVTGGGTGGDVINLRVNSGSLIVEGAIGGGSSNTGNGGNASITVLGGTFEADGIGGGSSADGDGGNATIAVTGGRFTVNGDIGGGSSGTGNGGTCMATFTGGTIQASVIGGGFSNEKGYSTATIIVDGGSLNCMMPSQPKNSNGVSVYKTTITVYDSDKRIEETIDISGISAGESSEYYKIEGIYLNESSMLYLWLPAEASVSNVIIGENAFVGVISSGSAGVLKYSSSKNYYNVNFPYDDRYTISYDKDGFIQIQGAWSAAMGESVSFYVHPKKDANGEYYKIDVYRSNDNAHKMDEFAKDVSSTESRYYFKMTVTSDTEILIKTTDSTGASRISLDLAQTSVVLESATVYVGGYMLEGYEGSYMLTSGGLPTKNNLRVESGEHDIYVNYLNAESTESIIYLAGGTVNLTASDIDNRAISTNNSTIYVAEGAVLNVNIDGINSLKLGADTCAYSAIGGNGTVNLVIPSGFLGLYADLTRVTQITAMNYTYSGSLTEGKIPYTLTMTESELFGYWSATDKKLLLKDAVLTANVKYTATSILFVKPADISEDDITVAVNADGCLVFTVNQAGYTVGTVMRDDAQITLMAAECYGNLIIPIISNSADDISYTLKDVTFVYDKNSHVYDGLILQRIEGNEYKVEYRYTTDGSTWSEWSETAPSSINVVSMTLQFRISVNSNEAVELNETKTFSVTQAKNEWVLSLTCASVINGETPNAQATSKFGNVIYTFFKYEQSGNDMVETELGNTPPTTPNGLNGYYAVKAAVYEDASGNYTALDSGMVYFTIDSASIYHTLGRDYAAGFQSYSTENNVILDKQKIFTVYYDYYYTPSAGTIAFKFSKKLPQGTVLSVLKYAEDKSFNLYYYVVPEGGADVVEATEFINAGSTSANGGFQTSGNSPRKESLKLCIALPNTYDNAGFTLEIKQFITDIGEGYIAPELNVVAQEISVPSASASGTGGSGKLTTTVSVGNSDGNDIITVQLLDASGNAYDFPAGTLITLKKGETEIVCTKAVGNIAFFEGISNGEYVLMLDMQTAHIALGERIYKLSVALCDEIDGTLYSMGNALTESETENITVSQYILPAIKANLGEGERYVLSAEGGALTFTVLSVGDGEISVSAEKKIDGVYTVYNGINIIKTEENAYTVSVPADTPSGAYRIVFVKGDAVFSYSIIVYDE